MKLYGMISRVVRVVVDPRVGFYYKAVIVAVFSAWYMEYSVLDAFPGTVQETPPVLLRSGIIQGQILSTPFGRQKYYSFQGIPYAKPPLGNLRFMPPQPAEPWEGVLTTFKERNKCMQTADPNSISNLLSFHSLRKVWLLVRSIPGIVRFVVRQAQESENCLFVNVYSPQLPSGNHSRLLPVMIWLHGGAFRLGSGDTDLFGPEYFMDSDQKIVLVTGNYRLGPFGFLSYEKGGVPGNAGMRDQVAMLKWVQSNIASFGGDPHRVTIFGESAGGTSVQMHLLSPLSTGLFHRAISQSGTALNPRSTVTSDQGTQRAQRLAKLLDIPVDRLDDAEIVRRLKELPAKSLSRVSENVLSDEEKRGFELAPFVPAIENGFTGVERFLSDTPQNLLNRGKIAPVPYMTGLNSQESIYLLTGWRSLNYTKVNDELEKFVPSDLNIPPRTRESRQFAKKMKDFYFKDQPVSKDTIYNLLELYSDVFVCMPVHRAINIQTRVARKPFYVYYFTYDGNLSFSSRILDNGLKGVSHGDELGYMFPIKMLPANPTEEDRKMVKRVIRIWTNMAYSGNPNSPTPIAQNVEWVAANASPGAYQVIDLEPRLRRNLLSERMKFWDQYYTLEEGGAVVIASSG